MAPKQKITREAIVEAGYRLVQTSGIESVNSRTIAQVLGCSTQPVFSQFSTMEELRQVIHDYACHILEQEVLTDYKSGSLLTNSYLKITRFAKKEHNLFRLIYLSEYCKGIDFIQTRMNYQSNQKIWQELFEKYQLLEEDCSDILERISLLVHGIATLLATTNVAYSDEKIVSIVETTITDLVVSINNKRRKT